jgi:hypothetical protein
MAKSKALSKTDDLDAILARTNKENPDPADLKVLREILDENPDLIALYDPTRRASSIRSVKKGFGVTLYILHKTS